MGDWGYMEMQVRGKKGKEGFGEEEEGCRVLFTLN